MYQSTIIFVFIFYVEYDIYYINKKKKSNPQWKLIKYWRRKGTGESSQSSVISNDIWTILGKEFFI